MENFIEFSGRRIGKGSPPYIIAEACINHEGDIGRAREMVLVARDMGCDAIKFQIHILSDEMLKNTPQSDNFDESLYDALERTNLSVEEHKELKAYCCSVGIHYMCTPFSCASVDVLEGEIGVDVFKVGSGELTNLPLQRHIAKKGKPMIVSTGMAMDDEIKETVEVLVAEKAKFVLMHCVSIYPCPYERVNLGNIPKLQSRYGVPVGLSDHTSSIYTGLGAVALGANIIEKHFTLDRNMKGPDHSSSIEPRELGELVKGSRAIFKAMGEEKRIFPEEEQIKSWARESVVSLCFIPAGTLIANDMVSVKRPAPFDDIIAAKHLDDIIGRVAVTDISENSQIRWSQLGE